MTPTSLMEHERYFTSQNMFQDSDGKLSKTEFLSFSHPEEDQGMYDAVVKSLLRNKDKNGDGVIDFQVGRGNVISSRLQMSSLKKTLKIITHPVPMAYCFVFRST